MHKRTFIERRAKLIASLAALLALSASPITSALPSFAQQTEQPCSMCHVGGFGPQLTPFGRAFKLGGYTLGSPDTHALPLAAMLVASYTQTKADQPNDAGPHHGPNDNFSLQEASLFYAGRITEHLGAFAQATYSDIDRHLRLDNVDVRYAQTVKLGDKPVIFGATVNNNPTVQDAWNTVPAWRFPYMASGLVPTVAAAPLIEGGLEHQVIGLSGYALYDNQWYAELGGYRSLSHGFLSKVDVEDIAGSISGIAPYWRFAYTHEKGELSWSLGTFGLDARLHPGRMPGPTDKFRDTGADASLQYAHGPHTITLNGTYTHEHQNRAASFASGTAVNPTGRLNSTALNSSYYYNGHYGLTLARFDLRGSRDEGLFAPAPASGSVTGKPNSSGTTLQADWTPFGAKDSWQAPWANVRFGLQYTMYDKFNGAARNYDGFGRNARDNDTLFLFMWVAL